MVGYKNSTELGLPINSLAAMSNFLIISSPSMDGETFKDYFVPLVNDAAVFKTMVFYLTRFLEDNDEIPDNIRWRKSITD